MIVQCPSCGAAIDAAPVGRQETITVGWPESDAIQVQVTVPVWHCPLCSFEWTDHFAEEIRDDAVRTERARRGGAFPGEETHA